VVGAGEVSLFSESGRNVEGRIDSKYEAIEPETLPEPFTGPEYRVVSSDGTLEGNSYSTRIHTSLDGAKSLMELDGMESSFR